MLTTRLLFAAVLLAAGPLLAQASVEFEDCRLSAGPGYPGIDARCATLQRPLDPDNPDAGSIDLKIAVVPALTLEPPTDPFVPIAGGPGQSTLQFYAAWFGAFERVRQQRDILLVDQRGTGDSAQLTCDVDDDIVEGAYSQEQTLRATEACIADLPHDPRFFTTSVAVADLEAVREALGYGPLNLYGISYGSRVAQHFTRRYPESTRAVIVDGVVPPQVPLGPDIAIESQAALERVFGRCAEDADCAARFPTLRESFAELEATLDDGTLLIDMPHPVTGELGSFEFGSDHFTAAVRMLLYSPDTVALLPLLIDAAAHGNMQPLAAQFQMIAASLAEQLSIGMHNAVMCTEDVPFIDWDDVDYGAIEASYLGPLQLEAIRTMCSVWPTGIIDPDLRTPLATDKPVLLLSGDADPITPPDYATLAAVDLRNAWLLTGSDQGHGLARVGCMPRVVADFVASAELPAGAAECLQDAFVMPFFLNLAGPAP